MRKLLFIAVLLPILAGLGWWYFREQALPNYGPAFREYAYVTNGKSNTVSVIDLRTFGSGQDHCAWAASPPDSRPTARRTKSTWSTPDRTTSASSTPRSNTVVATIGVHGRPYFIDVAEDGKRAYVANSGSTNVSVIDLEKRLVIGNLRVGAAPGWRGFRPMVRPSSSAIAATTPCP